MKRCRRRPSTNFTVVRVKRDILRRSTIGAMFTNRNKLDRRPPAAATRRTASTRRSVSTRTSRSARYYARTETTERQRRQRQLPGQVRLVAGSLRRERRSTQGRRRPSIRKSASCAAPTSRDRLRRRASARGRSRRSWCASTPRRRATSTTRTAPATVESRQATGRFNVEFNNSDVVQHRSERQLRLAADAVFAGAGPSDSGRRLSLQRHVDVATTWASSAGSPATSACSSASTTTAPSRR